MATCLMCEVCPAVSSQAGSSDYSLPTASTTQKGGVVVGAGLSMVGDTLNVTLNSDDFIGEVTDFIIEALQLAGS